MLSCIVCSLSARLYNPVTSNFDFYVHKTVGSHGARYCQPWSESDDRVSCCVAHRSRAKYCHLVCLYVCPYFSNHMSKSQQISLRVSYLWPWLSDDNAMLCTWVFWMTFSFHTVAQIQIQIQAGSVRCSELFTVTRQVAPLNSKLCYSRLLCYGRPM